MSRKAFEPAPGTRIGVIPRGVKVGPAFRGVDSLGRTALVREAPSDVPYGSGVQYVQMDDITHPHAFGWHLVAPKTFHRYEP